jgi:hypothetical protein
MNSQFKLSAADAADDAAFHSCSSLPLPLSKEQTQTSLHLRGGMREMHSDGASAGGKMYNVVEPNVLLQLLAIDYAVK